jgi:hypothetical protein
MVGRGSCLILSVSCASAAWNPPPAVEAGARPAVHEGFGMCHSCKLAHLWIRSHQRRLRNESHFATTTQGGTNTADNPETAEIVPFGTVSAVCCAPVSISREPSQPREQILRIASTQASPYPFRNNAVPIA